MLLKAASGKTVIRVRNPAVSLRMLPRALTLKQIRRPSRRQPLTHTVQDLCTRLCRVDFPSLLRTSSVYESCFHGGGGGGGGGGVGVGGGGGGGYCPPPHLLDKYTCLSGQFSSSNARFHFLSWPASCHNTAPTLAHARRRAGFSAAEADH